MIPVSIITGFLGSGKTTLLNRLLQDASLKNAMVIVNELGEIGIDHLLVSAADEQVRLLSSGCLCCELRGDLVDTLTDISMKRARGELPRFDRVLVETTGLADPVSIVQTIVCDAGLSQLYELDTVLCLVDAVHAVSQIASHPEAVKQIALSDVVVISKGDLAGPEGVASARVAVRQINAAAECMTAVSGNVAPEHLFVVAGLHRSADDARLRRWLSLESDDNVDAHRHYAPDVQTHTVCFDGPVTHTGLATWLTMLGRFGTSLLRMKGIVNVEGEPYVVHAVQSVVHEPVHLTNWPGPDRRTRVVFIVRGLDRRALDATASALSMPKSLGRHALHIDPAAYARFVQAACDFV